MDIRSAIHYLKQSYRIRRKSWKPEEYVYELIGLYKKEVHESHSYSLQSKTIETRYSIWDDFWQPTIEDLLADDWEAVTSNIRKHYNKHFNLEYDDEPDWDNYVCRGWGMDEEEDE